MKNRMNLLVALGKFALLLLVAGNVTRVPAAAPGDRPNFLFIFTDDQQWDAMGVVQREQGAQARFPWIKTPNMDRIAAEGVRFRNAFVVNSLCSPSRATFLTSRYSHLNGVANNHTPLPANSVTYATQLRAAGYMTGYIGKFHMGNQSGQRPGFEYSASFVGQGRYENCPFEINGVATPTKGWVDDVSTDFALEFLKKNAGKPFSLSVGFKSSHGPWEPAERMKERYSGEEPRPAINASSLPIYHRPAGGGETPEAPKRKNASANAGKAEMVRNYMRVLAGVDENLGRILKALDDLHLAENTILIYTTDNGYYLGEHSLGDKRSAYEESLRIPLLIRYPKLGLREKTLDQIALNLDLAPTLLDFAGVAIPREMQGLSWRPLLEGKKVEWRQSFFYEYFYERGYEGTPTVLALRTESAKLIQYPGHDEWRELFDVQSDPHEMNNLARDPAQKEFLQQMINHFDRSAAAAGFVVPDFADKPGDEKPRKGKGKAGKGGGAAVTPGSRSLNELVLAYLFAKDDGTKVLDASGKNNAGTAHGTTVIDGRAGGKARHFDGKTYIDVPKSASLNCAEGPWTVEAVVKADQPNGVILARGGQSLGYALYLEDGRPVFAVNPGKLVKCTGEPLPAGQWVHLAGVIGKDLSLTLYANGAAVAHGKIASFINRDPNDTMQIGADTGSPVTSYKGEGFIGDISLVRVYSGERTSEEIRQAAESK